MWNTVSFALAREPRSSFEYKEQTNSAGLQRADRSITALTTLRVFIRR